jgi:putative hydrolase of the HAD superfamily
MTGPSGPRPRRPLRALLFDAGNTLVRIKYAAIAGELRRRGHLVDAATVEEAEIGARVRLDPHLTPGASTESAGTHDRYLRYLLEPLGITDEEEIADLARWRRAYNQPLGLWTEPETGASDALRAVKAAGLVAGVISNSNGMIRSILTDAGLVGHLDVVIDSGVVGVEKPDPRIFALALGEAGVAAEEALYVGDLYSVDVLGARRAGLEAILLDPRGLWGPRDCLRAASLAAAVALALSLPRAAPG